MLQRLTIRDFVLVERLELEFDRGFGALTGETGAGKSILVDALSFVLGERADAGLVRSGRERAEVSAEFDCSRLPAIADVLQNNDLAAAEGGELLLRRVVDAGGRSRAYLNGTLVTLQQLREVTDLLIDIHGQHAHQSLLRAEAQRAIIDDYAGQRALASEVAVLWRVAHEAEARFRAAQAGGEQLLREREQLGWEVEELSRLAFQPAEWEALNAEQSRLAHAAALLEGAQSAVQGLGDGDGACLGSLSQIAGRLEQLAGFDERLKTMVQLVRAAEADVGEAVSELRRYAARIDLDPARLGEVDQRIDAVLSCARKYRVPIEQLPAALAERESRLQALAEGADPAALEKLAVQAEHAYRKKAEQLSTGRRKAAEALSKLVSEKMHELALGTGRFEVVLLPEAKSAAYGLERVEFCVAALAGKESRPLAKVASGGELSRISLALQVVTSGAAAVPTLIFDEVDVGIGGGVAEVVGRLLRQLGQERQVLCVTHLPQVAARANWQWQVRKERKGEDFHSSVVPLGEQARVEEIARMLGGVEITALTRQHAKEMLAVR
jgi:DNA repair protein RecN (Recombination protein N)